MDIENIVSLVSSGISLIGIVIYFIMWLKNSKKSKTEKINTVLERIKGYVEEANKFMPEATKSQKRLEGDHRLIKPPKKMRMKVAMPESSKKCV